MQALQIIIKVSRLLKIFKQILYFVPFQSFYDSKLLLKTLHCLKKYSGPGSEIPRQKIFIDLMNKTFLHSNLESLINTHQQQDNKVQNDNLVE